MAVQVDDWHRARGFHRLDRWRARWHPDLTSIGYHYVIGIGGAIETGRHLDEIGAHVVGNNKTSIGLCMVGTDRFTPRQWAALSDTVGGLQRLYPKARLRGHRELSPDQDNDGLVEPWEWLKSCPGFDVAGWNARGRKPLPEHILEGASR